MKTTVGTLVLLGAALTAGLALAQTPQQPRGGASAAPGTRSEQRNNTILEELDPRATISQSGGTLAIETIAPRNGPVPIPGCGPVSPTPTSPSTRSTAAPVNGIGGQGGGRLSNRDHIDQDAQFDARGVRLINNSETETAVVDGAAARPGPGGRAPATPACTPAPAPRR